MISLPHHDLVADGAIAVGDRARIGPPEIVELVLELGHARLQARQRLLEREHVLDTGVVEAERGRERLDAPETREVGIGVEAPATG